MKLASQGPVLLSGPGPPRLRQTPETEELSLKKFMAAENANKKCICTYI